MTASLLLGCVCIVFAAILWRLERHVRSGENRKWLRIYRDSSQPWWLRNGALLLRYDALFVLLSGLALMAGAVVPAPTGVLVAGALGVLALPFGVLAFVGAYRAPDSLKPAWLLAEEQEAPPQPTTGGTVLRVADLAVILIPLCLLIVAVMVGGMLLIQTWLR